MFTQIYKNIFNFSPTGYDGDRFFSTIGGFLGAP